MDQSCGLMARRLSTIEDSMVQEQKLAQLLSFLLDIMISKWNNLRDGELQSSMLTTRDQTLQTKCKSSRVWASPNFKKLQLNKRRKNKLDSMSSRQASKRRLTKRSRPSFWLSKKRKSLWASRRSKSGSLLLPRLILWNPNKNLTTPLGILPSTKRPSRTTWKASKGKMLNSRSSRASPLISQSRSKRSSPSTRSNLRRHRTMLLCSRMRSTSTTRMLLYFLSKRLRSWPPSSKTRPFTLLIRRLLRINWAFSQRKFLLTIPLSKTWQ